MKSMLAGLLCVVSVPVLYQEAELRFAPVAGQQVSVDYERVFYLKLEDTETTMAFDGEDQGPPESADMGYAMTETESIRYTDTFDIVGDEVVGIRRHFSRIGNLLVEEVTDPLGEEFIDENKGQSELEGGTVVFTREGDAKGLEAEFDSAFDEASKGLDEELLEGLEARADLMDFLPDEAVAPGARWEIPVSAFIRMTNLSGDLSVVQEGDDQDEPDDGYGEQFDEKLRGSFTAKFEEICEMDGERIAVIVLHAELETTVLTINDLDAEEAEGTEEDEHTFSFELDGFLHWNLGAGHAKELELSGEITLVMDSNKKYSFEGHELVIHEVQSYLGTLDFAATID
ncbi:MAG: hypothetical protein ACI9F9_002364 [Candidatus Paceibacteria bacterium]|jgi:hypothetical protein